MGHPSHHAADASRVPQSGELGFAARPLCAPNHVHAPLFPFERTEQWMVQRKIGTKSTESHFVQPLLGSKIIPRNDTRSWDSFEIELGSEK